MSEAETQVPEAGAEGERGELVPLWILMLKAERVQTPKAGSRKERLAARRLQERLKKMPGWAVTAGGVAIFRERDFVHSADAADYAACVIQMTNRQQFPADVFVAGKRVVVALRGRVGLGAQDGVNDNLLDFAASLG